MKTILLILSITIFSCNSLFAQSGWFSVYSDTSSNGQSTFFTNINTGYLVGSKKIGGVYFPRVLKTTNAGSSWFEQITPQRDSANFWCRGTENHFRQKCRHFEFYFIFLVSKPFVYFSMNESGKYREVQIPIFNFDDLRKIMRHLLQRRKKSVIIYRFLSGWHHFVNLFCK